jgi:hypothetical protein
METTERLVSSRDYLTQGGKITNSTSDTLLFALSYLKGAKGLYLEKDGAVISQNIFNEFMDRQQRFCAASLECLVSSLEKLVETDGVTREDLVSSYELVESTDWKNRHDFDKCWSHYQKVQKDVSDIRYS